MVECRIPGHITGLYIFAVVNLCALLNFSLVSADVFVINAETNETIVQMQDNQAKFGPDFPNNGLKGYLVYVMPHDACSEVEPPPPGQEMPWIALISRGPCHFDKKVLLVQTAGFSAAIVHNYKGDDSVMPMAGDSQFANKVHIPSVFVGYTDGMDLAHHYSFNSSKKMLIKIQEDSVDPFTNYFWPFTVVVSICFLGVVIFAIVKCVRYFQYRRRTRLSKRALKKIPTRKYKKGDHYDTCAICLDDYEEGEKLRVLPCNHTYHCKCIDPWLTKRKKTCPQCKRRVIPGHDSDSESESDADTANENTPLLANNNAPGPSRPSLRGRGAATAFERSGLPAAVQPDVVVISVTSQPLSDDDDDDDDESEDDAEGAVGGVGISEKQEGCESRVVVEVEKVPQTSATADTTPTDTPTPDTDTTPLVPSQPPARVQGSINAAFSSSGSGGEEEEGGRSQRRKKASSNQVV